MILKGIFIVFVVAVCQLRATEVVPYQGYKVYETIPRHQNQTKFLSLLAESAGDVYDFWKLSRVVNDAAHIMVPPEYQKGLETILTENKIEYSVMISDVAEHVEREKKTNEFVEFVSSKRMDFNNFKRFSDINAYLDELANKYKNLVTVKEVGKSFEGRSLKTITISNGDHSSNKKTIFVDAGIHAREWIAPATALYIINQLVENFNQNKNLLQKFNWIVLPVVNPDGYEYTHTKERFWRKTRKPNKNCAGTDGNRNFGYHWGEVGASSSECSETFRGPSAFSEPETQIVRKILQEEKGRCKFYLTLHSYGQYLLYPWGWTSSLPSSWKDIDEVAQAGASAMRSATGSKYTVGSSTNVLYAAAGGSDDYAFAEGIPISITMELPGNTFNPPASQIKSMVTEAWTGIKAMAEKVEKKYA